MSKPEPDGLSAFEFINDPRFRASLVSDYREMGRSFDSGSWKAVHVLAGSIIEAVLVDYLLASKWKAKGGKDPLTMELSEAIDACKKEGVLSQKAADLSSVVRGYRNLIHPGRVIRLGEKVDDKGSTIAKALVDLIVEEVVAAKTDTYGFTAEQIASKIEMDSSSVSVLAHFLKETKDSEKERLLTDVIPERYFGALESDFPPSVSLSDMEESFRLTFSLLPDDSKKTVARKFVRLIKEGTEKRVMAYETAFFRAGDLAYLSKDEASLVKDHILARLARHDPAKLLPTLEGIGPFLAAHEVGSVVDVLVRLGLYGKTETQKEEAQKVLEGLYMETEPPIDASIQTRVDAWVSMFEEQGKPDIIEAAKQIRSRLDAFPF